MHWPLRVSDAAFSRWYPPGWDLAYDRPGDLTPRVDELLAARIGPGAVVLDYGAGATANWVRQSMCGKLVGVDVDPAVLKNPALHESVVVAPDGPIPYPDGHFDAAVAHWVFEHLSRPGQSLREIVRVLKPDAPLIFITLNRRHWMCAVAQCLPREMATFLAETLGQKPAGAGRAFDVYFRLNTARDISLLAGRAGLRIEQLRFFETYPAYLRMISPLFPLGVFLERLLNRSQWLAPLRVNIVGVLRRHARSGRTPR
ncbi:MAG: class I SAM-dependent methyltransferase [Tepidisphaeraceae bacterium]|jgi:SAM-dependent methyltransferase